MKLSLAAAVCLICLVLIMPSLNAQQSYHDMVVMAGMTDGATSKNVKSDKVAANPYKGKSPEYFRHHKRLPATFSGYAIELEVTEKPMRRDNELFSQFGNVFYKQLESGEYAYYILLDFKSKKAMKKYLTQVVHHRVPEARLVVYSGGTSKTK